MDPANFVVVRRGKALRSLLLSAAGARFDRRSQLTGFHRPRGALMVGAIGLLSTLSIRDVDEQRRKSPNHQGGRRHLPTPDDQTRLASRTKVPMIDDQ
jgi:hypothetical protein